MAQVRLETKLDLIEAELAKNSKGNRFFFNNKHFTYADARVSPYLVRLYAALKEGNYENLNDISLKEYPLLVKYIKNLLADDKLAPAYGKIE